MLRDEGHLALKRICGHLKMKKCSYSLGLVLGQNISKLIIQKEYEIW